MLQSIILQTIFLSFTLLGCSENKDVCGNENGGGRSKFYFIGDVE